jgi:hypothetical protein
MSNSIHVSNLRVEAASGGTPNDGGSSAIWGEAEVEDKSVIQILDEKFATGVAVTLRCGALEVSGLLSQQEGNTESRFYRIRVQGIRYG